MKKNLFFITVLLVSFTMNAQFTVETHEGNPILDGDVIAFNKYGANEDGRKYGNLPFYVYNTSMSPIDMRIEFVSAQNTDGSMMQLCFGLCYTSITLGESYPPNGGVVNILPGQHQTSTGDHFWNSDPGNGTQVLDYVFKFYQVDNAGNQIGTPLTMTYRYDPLLATKKMNRLEVAMYPTMVNDFLTVETDEVLNMQVYDLQGRLVKSNTLSVGHNKVGMQNMAAQMYLVRFENELGASHTSKVIVK